MLHTDDACKGVFKRDERMQYKQKRGSNRGSEGRLFFVYIAYVLVFEYLDCNCLICSIVTSVSLLLLGLRTLISIPIRCSTII